MEQEEAIEGLLCDTPSLLPTLSLSLTSSEGSQTTEGSEVAPAAQTVVSSNSQGKGIKVGDQGSR